MNKEINLLPAQKRDSAKDKRILFILRVVSISSLFFVILSSIVIFLLNQAYSNSSIKKEKNSILLSLSLLDKKIGKSLFVESRLKDINLILKERASLDERLRIILKEVPKDSIVNTLTIEKKKVVITLSSSSLSSLDLFLNNMLKLFSEKKIISKISLGSLSFDERNNRYILSVLLDLV